MARSKKSESFDSTGLEKVEAKLGKKLFENYRNNYNISQLSDTQILSELVYREILQLRYKTKISEKEIHNAKEDSKKQSTVYLVRSLNENLEQILTLKEKLGLFETKKDNDSYKALETLKKKFQIWLKENQASRTLICPMCSKMIMLRMKTESWEAQKHPMFKDRILANDHLIKLYMDKKITDEDVAKVLGTSKDYTKWLISKWYDKDSNTPTV